jgi:hypothetical protein
MDRRSFVKRAGATTGLAALGAASPGIAAATQERDAEAIEPTAEVPNEPVVAYVRDASRGEVTVLSGTRETTYRDPALAKRLVKAGTAPRRSSKEVR